MSGPEPDWIDDVERACRSLPLMVSMVSLMPSAFSASGTISFFKSSSEVGMKSFQRNQCTVAAWAKAGAREVARIAAIPPVFAATAPAPESRSRFRL